MTFIHPHQQDDWSALETARRIAARIQEQPELSGHVRSGLAQLCAGGREFAAHCDGESILDAQPLDEVFSLLVTRQPRLPQP